MDEIAELGKNIKLVYGEFLVNRKVESPIVSVVVPVYNVELYLKDCLLSLIKQTLKEIEIIVVNDGSTDNSRRIVEEFCKYDSRIKLINQENAGPSEARNTGLKVVQGKYISFVDSDDWVDENFLEKLYNSAKNNNADISVATVIRKRKYTQKYRVHYTTEQIYESLETKIKICNIPTCCYVWNKLYKKELIDGVEFSVGRYFEDVLWLPEIVKKANKIVTVPNTSYYYRVNNNSIVKKRPSRKKQEDSYLAKKYIKGFFEENNIPLTKRQKNITKSIKYFANIPVLKIKECENCETLYLLGFLPIYKRKNDSLKYKFKKVKKIFFFRKLDSHIYINILRQHLSFKAKEIFPYKEVKNLGVTEKKRSTKLIVSLTSFPGRIRVVEKTINTLLDQTLKPDELILWLAEEQFPNKEENLPASLMKLKEYGLTIKWCEDLRSYKKLIPALREFPNDIIVTADDDLYYQRDWLESLYSEYLKDPKNIYTRRACRIVNCGSKFKIFPHYDNKHYEPTFTNQLMGGAGTLYPPRSLHSDVLNSEKFMALLPTYDDIYFWVMAVVNNTKIGLIKNNDLNFYNIENSQENALCKINGIKFNMNYKEAFSVIFEAYPEIIEKLK